MTTLAILVHADPSVRAAYQAALPPDTDLLILNAPGGGRSSAYTQLARSIAAGPGTMLEAVVRRAGGLTLDRYTGGVVLATFSAGYGLARELLWASDGSDRQLSGLVAIDSWHAGFDPDHTAADAQLDGLIRYAGRALAGECVCWLAHTDVETPQDGPEAFASTTQVVDEVQRLMGLPGDPVDWSDGGLRLRGRDEHVSDHAEHVAALTVWGPDWLGDAVRALHQLRGPMSTEPAPAWDDGLDLSGATIGERCCAWLGFQFGTDPREIPGPEHEPVILSYSAHCRRGGTFLGVRDDGKPRWLHGTPLALWTDEQAWCAALQSGALCAVLRPGETPPHGLRVSVRELVEDARLAGTLRPAEWGPTPGSIAILARYVGGTLRDPLSGGNGHTRCVLQVDGERYLGLGGNEGNAIGLGWHRLDDGLLRGWVER
jgi:hypothetical protein